MKTETPRTIRLADYTPPPYRATHVDLTFDLDPTATRVRAATRYEVAGSGGALVLNGEHLKLISITIDGRVLSANDYVLDDDTLTLAQTPAKFELAIETEINPEANKALEGLYRSKGKFTTQC
ncbi:MAG: aminopeptidase N, partial [Alphaproteobacteria bacterium]|nr:aminopeptidase N [Alphaproteobacteria bacterium]